MRVRGFSYIVATAAMFGLGAVLAKIVVAYADPMIVTFLNLSVGCCLLAVYLKIRNIQHFPSLQRSDWLNLLLAAVVGTAISLFFIIYGLSYTSAIKGGFLIQLQGLAAVFFSMLLLHERLTIRQALGVLLIILGSSFVVLRSFQANLIDSINWGDLSIILGALCGGLAFPPAKKLSSRIHPLQLSFLRLLFGSLTMLVILLPRLGQLRWQYSPTLLWAMPLLIITNFCLAYIMLHLGIRLLKAWEAASILQTEPIFSTIFAIILLHDAITPLQIMGGMLMFAGGLSISLANERPKPQSGEAAYPLKTKYTPKSQQ